MKNLFLYGYATSLIYTFVVSVDFCFQELRFVGTEVQLMYTGM